MINKVIFITLLVAFSTCYTEQGHVIVLTDDDFPDITTKFSHILIEFYAPWCGHCKKLEPVYKQVADELKAQGSVLRVAKLDATVHKKAAEQYEVKGFPTLFFFYNGEKLDYNGPRTKEGMLGWLLKRTRDPVSQIDAAQYEKLSSEKFTSIVYHGDFSTAKGAEVLNKLAIADDYNNFYWGKNLGKEQGTLQLIRNFAESVTHSAIDDKVKTWIEKNERPPVVPFDERAIGTIFSSGKKGVVLFNGQTSAELLQAFTEAAKQHDGESFVFTEVAADNEHLDNFASYLKLDRKAFPVIIVEAKAQTKYVLKEEPTKQNILGFLKNYKEFKYGITDQVKATAKPAEQTAQETVQEQL